MSKALLITGTDTNVGKTVLTCCLAAYWLSYCNSKSLAIIKLMQTGVGDRETYQQLFEKYSSLEIVTPLYFSTPVAPPIAAEKEGTTVDLNKVWLEYNHVKQRRDFVIVEALGGLGSPVTHELTVANIAADWHLSTILVVPVKLGAIAQAVANVALARELKVNLKGIILSCFDSGSEEKIEDWTPVDLIQSLTNIPVLGILPHILELSDLSKLAHVASNFDLERFFFP